VYEEALGTYLARFPKSDAAAEVRFLLAELHRARGDCTRAEGEYSAVGPGPFAGRARLGALECRVGELAKAKSPPPEQRREIVEALRAFTRETDDKALAARAALLGALVAAGGTTPDHAAVLELLDGFEQRYPQARDLHDEARERRLVARIATGEIAKAEADLDAYLAAGTDGDQRRRTLARIARDLTAQVERDPQSAAALPLARKTQRALVVLTDAPADRITLADLELRGGDGATARRLYEEALARSPDSAEALRGAARAAAVAGDREAALGYWRRVLDGSPAGGTAWYEARIAQVDLLARDGQRARACEIIRSSRGRATSAGGDQLEARLRSLEPEVCK
jgi:tetratricopeptide (TPR) repeat protein